MAIEFCWYRCGSGHVVAGSRNERKRGGPCARCRWRALLEMAHEDMLTREEADELAALLAGAAA